MSGTAGKRLNLRLFLEGQETPVVSASVTAKITSPATASIQVVATDKILNLKPRTLVHLFFLDSYEADEKGVPYPPLDVGAAAKKQGLPENVALNDPAQNKRYKLLFSGEILGLGFAKTAGSRQAVLKCADFTSYWDSAKQFYKAQNVMSSQNSNRVISFIGGSTQTYNSFLGYGSSGKELYNLLKSSPATKPGMTGLLGGIVHVMESMGGVSNKPDARFKGVNDFFSMAELRLRLMEMVGALEYDKTAKYLLKGRRFRRWMTKKIKALGGIASYRDVINEVMRHIHHITAPNPVAYFNPGGAKTKIKVTSTVRIPNKDVAAIDKIVALLTECQAALTKSESMIALQSDFEASFAPNSEPGSTNTVKGWITAWVVDGVGQKNPKIQVLLNALSPSTRAAVDPKVLATYQEKSAAVVPGAFSFNSVDYKETADAYNGLAASLVATKKGTSGTRTTTKEVESNKGLYNTLLIPECWFVAPPRCNIIFPDMYGSFTFSRSFLRETTRLQITVSSRREIVAGTGIYSGLNFGGVRKVYKAPDTTLMKAIGVGPATKQIKRLMPHEIHGGIIPGFEWMGQINQLLPADGKKKSKKRTDYINRLVSYQFLKRRFSARTLAGNGKMNPYLVPGFPAVVMDRTVTSSMAEYAPKKTHAQLLEMVKNKQVTAPTQYIGLVHSVTHQVSQAGGSTSFQLSHVRTLDEDREFLGLDKKGTKKKKEVVTDTGTNPTTGQTATNEVVHNALTVLALARTAHETGLPLEHRSLSEERESLGTTWSEAIDEAILKCRQAQLSDLKTVRNKAARAQKELEFARTEFSRTGGKHRTTFSSLETWLGAVQRAEDLLETIKNQKTETRYTVSFDKDLPAEEAIRPPFYDSIYGNSSIGEKVYTPLIGIGAITDKLDAKTTTLDVDVAKERSDELLRKRKMADALLGLETEDFPLPKDMKARTEKSRKEAESSRAFVDRLIKEAHFLGEGFTSSEDAINALTILYHYVEREGLDKDHFIGSYVRRPIATMVDIFGGSDEEGKPVEGFHQYAYGDVDPMVGGGPWLHSQTPTAELGDAGNPSVISPKLDPRREKYLAVQEYLNELRENRALRG